MVAGTNTDRTSVASNRTATASPKPDRLDESSLLLRGQQGEVVRQLYLPTHPPTVQ